MTPQVPGSPRGVWGRFRRQRASMLGLLVLVLLCLVALLADVLAADKPIAVRVDGALYLLPNLRPPAALRGLTVVDLRDRLDRRRGDWMIEPLVPYGPNQPGTVREDAPPWAPDARHLLGTDEIGRDVLARLIHGTRVSLTVGLGAVALYVALGLLLGALAGYLGGWVDAVVSRVTEVMMTFPTLFFILAVMGLMRVTSVLPLVVVIGLTRWTDVARLVRAEVLRIQALDFVEASRALGAGGARILLRHVLPHALGPVLVAATFGIASAILIETGLSFLGFGVPPPHPSWGELLTQAHRYLRHPGAWWLVLFPGLAIFVTVTAFNLVGEGLRDALDPKLRD